jgi:hypothetical protein
VAEFSDYAWLTSDEARGWLERLAADPRPELQQLAALRRELPVERARLAVEQIDLRRRAAAKFGSLAERMFFTRTLLEQATDRHVAGYKSCRLAAASSSEGIGDYCCGIGGDLLALAAQAPARGWDCSEIACLFASANLTVAVPSAVLKGESQVHCGDVEQRYPLKGEVWHVDPDRRASGVRASQVARYSPGPALIDRWLASHADGALKLAPAADVPAHWRERAELEWISSYGECRQQVAWFGRTATAPGKRRATTVRMVDEGDAAPAIATMVGTPRLPCENAHYPSNYLFDPNPAVLASDLLGELAAAHGLRTLGAGGAYLTGEAPVADDLLSPLAVDACLPLRAEVISRHLASHGVGRVEIKKRGVPVDPNKFWRQLKLRGSKDAVLVLTRIGRREVAIVARRVPRQGVSEATRNG